MKVIWIRRVARLAPASIFCVLLLVIFLTEVKSQRSSLTSAMMPVTSGTTVSVSPTSLIFSTQAIGTVSMAKTVKLNNAGTVTLTINSITIAGTNKNDFVNSADTCAGSLAVGTSCTVKVKFTPLAVGTRSAILSFTDDAAGSPQHVSLSGVGTTAKLSPTSLGFGTVTIGDASSAKTVTLTNVGSSTFTISGIAITATNAGDFAETNGCPSSLAATSSCTVQVTFKPTATGTRKAALSVWDSAAGSPQHVPLTGKGVTGTCTPYGGQCASIFPPCCPGLVCVPASTRAFCLSATSPQVGTQVPYSHIDKNVDHAPILQDRLPGSPW